MILCILSLLFTVLLLIISYNPYSNFLLLYIVHSLMMVREEPKARIYLYYLIK